ncbi:MAG TPA: low affinity iron permease family protein [Longimicrobiales bacterium]|nr:low affinity iron permease family protein [Longimicrobiales bacterium]
MNALFRRFSEGVARITGSAWTFVAAALVIVAWAVSGPMFAFSDTWQLVINTGTTVVTFLMVFLIQNTQNRDARAIHLKLDELIRAVGPARNGMVDLESLSDEELADLQAEFERLREQAERQHPGASEAVPPDAETEAVARQEAAVAQARHKRAS